MTTYYGTWAYWSDSTDSTSASTWSQWCSSTTVSYNTTTWEQWNSSGTATATSDTWYYWAEGPERQAETGQHGYRYSYQPQPETEEQKKKREAKEAKDKRKQEEAELKAEELLMDLIGESEVGVYRETDRVLVKGAKHDYLLEKEGKVTRVERDRMVDLCIAMKDRWQYPKVDNILALKLAINADEEAFNREANEMRRYERPIHLPLAARA